MDVTPKRPADYPKRILVALVGLAPAVVTETVYALASQDPAFIPTQVAVITTGMGKKLILRQLLADPENSHSNQFAKLRTDHAALGIGNLTLQSIDIRVPPNLDRNVTDEDAHENDSLDRMGDLILGTLAEFVQDNDTAICLSISGGRKSMSYLGGIAMTLVARAQDRLVHVLLNDPRLERAKPDYFYPPVKPVKYKIPSMEDQTESTVLYSNNIDCGVTLADVPLLKLGALLPGDMRAENIDPIKRPKLSQYVRMIQDALTIEEIELRFVRDIHSVFCNRTRVSLSQEEFLMLHCIAECSEQGFASTPTDQDIQAYINTSTRYARDSFTADRAGPLQAVYFYNSPSGFLGLDEEWPESYKTGLAWIKKEKKKLADHRASKFQPTMTDIRTKFQRALGRTLASRALPPKAVRGDGRLRFPADVEIILADQLPET